MGLLAFYGDAKIIYRSHGGTGLITNHPHGCLGVDMQAKDSLHIFHHAFFYHLLGAPSGDALILQTFLRWLEDEFDRARDFIFYRSQYFRYAHQYSHMSVMPTSMADTDFLAVIYGCHLGLKRNICPFRHGQAI